MSAILIIIPLLAAALAAIVRSGRWRPWLLPPVGAAHLTLTILALLHPDSVPATRWLALDPPGRIVLLIVSGLFFICSIYSVGYLRYRGELSNRIFCVALLIFLAATTLVICSRHLGLMWVAIEATTLATAPLIYFNRTPRSIEATWKYLLVGYGTKMGIAPMHTWKPDAYGEAPGVVGALLAGGVTNCAFLALLRVDHICRAAGEASYTGRLLVFMGILSMVVAAIFMVGQRDFKRKIGRAHV